MPTVIEVTNQDELEARRLVWKSLLCQTRGANICHTLDWIHLAWEHSYPQDWRILFVYSGRKPVGILPLTIEERSSGFGRMRILGYPSGLHAPSYSPIGPHPTATLTAAMRHVESEMTDWDVLEMRPVNRFGQDRQRTPTAMQLAGLQSTMRPDSNNRFIRLEGSWQDFLAQDGMAQRIAAAEATVVREFGEIHFRRVRPMGQMYGDGALPLELAQTLRLSEDPDDQDHWEKVLSVAAKIGAADICQLHCHDRPLAGSVAFYAAGQLTSLRSCLFSADTAEHRSEILTVLMARIVQDSLARGDDRICLADDHWNDWSNRSEQTFAYTHIPKSRLRAQLAAWLPHRWSISSR